MFPAVLVAFILFYKKKNNWITSCPVSYLFKIMREFKNCVIFKMAPDDHHADRKSFRKAGIDRHRRLSTGRER